MDGPTRKRNIQQFHGEKYGLWKFRIKNLLREVNVLNIVEEPVPTDPTNDWLSKDALAYSLICEYLSDALLSVVKTEKYSNHILAKLDSVYERKSLATQLSARKKLFSLKLQPNQTLVEHFTAFDDVITELISAGANVDEMDQIQHLLLTLPPNYDGIITALETLNETNLNLAFVKIRLLDYEIKLKNQDSTTVLFTNKEQQRTQSTSKRPYQQNYYKRSRQQTYGQQYGSFNNKYKKIHGKSPYKFVKKCSHCNRPGHLQRDCFHYKKMIEKQQEASRPTTLQAVQQSGHSNNNFAFMLGISKPCESDNKEIMFVLDSGASDHIVHELDAFTSFEELTIPIQIAVAKNGTTITATKRGVIDVVTNHHVKGQLLNVLYSPDIPCNLLSVRRMQEKGMTVIFDVNGVTIKHKNTTLISGTFKNNLIRITCHIQKCRIQKPNPIAHLSVDNKYTNFKLWHDRLGHVSNSKFVQIRDNNLVDDAAVLVSIKPINEICESCIFGKQNRKPFNKIKKQKPQNRPLMIVHSDLCGPVTPPSVDNKNYYLTFIDDFTHYTVTYLVTFKWEVLNKFKDYVAKATTHFNQKILMLYCDNGGEYLSNEFKIFCSQQGITYHLTVPHTPQQNGVAERMNRSLTEKARTMLARSELNKAFWGEAILSATYLLNRIPTKALGSHVTPYELWYNKKPSINHCRIFGATVYVHKKTHVNKFDNKSFKTILVGYDMNGYKLWDVGAAKFIIARDVIIDETNFLKTRPSINEYSDRLQEGTTVEKFNKTETSIININAAPGTSKSDIEQNKSQLGTQQQLINQTINQNNELRRSDRLKHQPKVNYYKENIIETHAVLQAVNDVLNIPTTFSEIQQRVDRIQWETAIKEELDALAENHTWSIVNKIPNINVVDCKWVFNIKCNINGKPVKYKARLVAKGFSQKHHIDYEETFAPVARMTSFRFILAFANQWQLLVHHMDVKTAFLNGLLKETIYMKIPEGVSNNDQQVCLLHKSLYGLKQSSRCWYEHFDNILKQRDFNHSKVDHCVYILDKSNINANIYVLLYVDDVVIVTKNSTTMKNFKDYLQHCFKMVDLDEIKLFLGIRIQRDTDCFKLDQSVYLTNVLTKYNMLDCKHVETPLPAQIDYESLNSDIYHEAPCRNAIGSLMYVMLCTRPDLCYAVNLLSRYQVKNNKALWTCIKRVLRYIKGTLNVKLIFKRNIPSKVELVGYTDADWANNTVDRKSTSGYLFKLFTSCLISWNSKRQSAVALSSTEAEYIALFEGVKEAIWLRSLASSINIKLKTPITIFEDNTGCISIANNPTQHKRSKHIDIKYHFLREQIQSGLIKLSYISTDLQEADMFTKGLPMNKFITLRTKIGLTK